MNRKQVRKKSAAKKKAAKQPAPTRYVYALRTCNADMTSREGFKWPTKGLVTCPDWQPTYQCGHGLHALLWGEGDGSLLDWSLDAKWLVLRGRADEVLHGQGALTDKCKAPRWWVVFAGRREQAVAVILARGAEPSKCVAASVSTSGDRAPATTSGYRAPATTSGDRAPATTSGHRAPATTSGDFAPATTSGYRAPATTAGHCAPATTAGHCAPATTSGDCAPATTSGDRAPATTSGDRAPATTSGYRAPATTAGKHGVAIGLFGAVRTGELGAIVSLWWDGNRYRVVTGYVGENGIKADQWYQVRDGRFVECAEPAGYREAMASRARIMKEAK